MKDEEKDEQSMQSTSKPKIGRVLKVENEGEQKSKEKEKDSLTMTDKIVLSTFVILFAIVGIICIFNTPSDDHKKDYNTVDLSEQSVQDELNSVDRYALNGVKSKETSTENKSDSYTPDTELVMTDLRGNRRSQSLNELERKYSIIKEWSIAGGFGSGKVSLYENGKKYVLVDFSQNMCYEMRAHKVKSNNEFICYALNGVNNYFRVDKGLTVFICPYSGTAYDNYGREYSHKMVLMSANNYAGLYMNDNSTGAGPNVYVEFLRLE